MYVLAFDTTAAACSILLKKNDDVLACFNKIMDFGQAEVLISELQKMLTDNNLKFADLNLLLVCVGPGSFTGVRSAISAARTFKLACQELSLGVKHLRQLLGVALFKLCKVTYVSEVYTKDRNIVSTNLPSGTDY